MSAPTPRSLLERCVSIPSVSGEEGELAHVLRGLMSEMGFTSTLDEAGNVVGQRGSGALQVMLLGHIDTVPGEIPVRVEGDLLFGRGSVDAKGPLCTFVSAVAQLSEAALEKATFTVVGAVEEEAPSSKGANFVKGRHAPDYVLIGEPSGWDALTLGYKGRLVVKACVSQSNFHSAGEGRSSADLLLDFIARVRAWAEEVNAGVDGLFGAVQLTAQSLSSDSDGMVQQAAATLGLRLPPALDPFEAQRQLEALAEGALALTLEFVGHERAYRGEKDTPLTRALKVAIRAHGGTPRLTLKTGTSDMNVVAPAWSVPMLAYGPGDSGLDHTPNEHLSLSEYDQAVAVLREALERLVGRA